jgi:hypothetical protein
MKSDVLMFRLPFFILHFSLCLLVSSYLYKAANFWKEYADQIFAIEE